MAITGPPLGAQAKAKPSPVTTDGTMRQWPIFDGFQPPTRHSSLPVAASWPVTASPPMTTTSLRGEPSKGTGVAYDSFDSATASLGRTTLHRSLPFCGSTASRYDSAGLAPAGGGPNGGTSRWSTCTVSLPAYTS